MKCLKDKRRKRHVIYSCFVHPVWSVCLYDKQSAFTEKHIDGLFVRGQFFDSFLAVNISWHLLASAVEEQKQKLEGVGRYVNAK
jgi:hypothetical protein